MALASVGTAATASCRRCAASGVRPRAPSRPPPPATSATRASTSAGCSSPSQPAPNTARPRGPRSASAARAASTTASHKRAAEAGLVAVGEHVAADVEQHDEVAAQAVGRGGDAGAHRGGAGVGVDQDDRLAGQLGHPRLGEAHAAGVRRVGAGQRHRVGRGARRRRPRPAGAVPGSGSIGRALPGRCRRRRPRPARRGSARPPPARRPRRRRRRCRGTGRARDRSTRASKPVSSGADGYGVGGDRRDLLRGAVELVVGEHRRALEGQVARAAPATSGSRRTRPAP